MHRPNALCINAETMYDYQIILLPPALECSYVALWQYPLQWGLTPPTPYLLPAHSTVSHESQSTHRVAINNNSISAHTFHFKYLKTFLTNRFEYLLRISKQVSQKGYGINLQKVTEFSARRIKFCKDLKNRHDSKCCVKWQVFRFSLRVFILVSRPSSPSICRKLRHHFLQNVAFSLRITRHQSVINTVLQFKGKAIPLQVYYRTRGLPDLKTNGIWRW
jgi:hypothetical protein